MKQSGGTELLGRMWIQLLSAPFAVDEKQRSTGIFPLSIHPPHEEELMKEYTKLTLLQRYEISVLHKVGQGPTQIARIDEMLRATAGSASSLGQVYLRHEGLHLGSFLDLASSHAHRQRDALLITNSSR